MTNGMTLAGMAPVQHSFLNNPYINRVLTGIIIAISLFFVSGDYWLLMKDKDGKVTQVLDDGQYDKINTWFVDGTFETKKNDGTSLTGQIAGTTNGKQSKSDINTIMMRDNLHQTERGWYGKPRVLMPRVKGTGAEDVQAPVYELALEETDYKPRISYSVESDIGDGSVQNPFITRDPSFVSQNDLAKRLKTTESGPCFISAATDPFVSLGKTPAEIMAAIVANRTGYLSAVDAGVSGSMPELWAKLGTALKTSSFPAYTLLDQAGKPINLSQKQFEAGNYQMALMGVYPPGARLTNPPSHWMFMHRSAGAWYAADPWTSTNSYIQRWSQGNGWDDFTRVYRPLEWKDSKK